MRKNERCCLCFWFLHGITFILSSNFFFQHNPHSTASEQTNKRSSRKDSVRLDFFSGNASLNWNIEARLLSLDALPKIVHRKLILNSFCLNPMWWLGISIAFYRLCKWMLVWARHQRRLFISHSAFCCTNNAFLLQMYVFRQNVCMFFLFSSAVLSCIPRQSIVVCCIWCSILFGEKRLYFVALVAFRIRLRLGRVRFVLFVFQCGFHVVALFSYCFFSFLCLSCMQKIPQRNIQNDGKNPFSFSGDHGLFVILFMVACETGLSFSESANKNHFKCNHNQFH